MVRQVRVLSAGMDEAQLSPAEQSRAQHSEANQSKGATC